MNFVEFLKIITNFWSGCRKNSYQLQYQLKLILKIYSKFIIFENHNEKNYNGQKYPTFLKLATSTTPCNTC